MEKEFSRLGAVDKAFFRKYNNFAIASISSDLILGINRIDNPTVSRELCGIHFKELLNCFRKNGMTIIPIEKVIRNDLYKSLKKEKRDIEKIPLFTDLEIMKGADSDTYSSLAKSLGVDGIITIWNRYQFYDNAKSGFFGQIFKGLLKLPKQLFTGTAKTEYNCILESHVQIYGINKKIVFDYKIKKISDITQPGEKTFMLIAHGERIAALEMKTLVTNVVRFHTTELSKQF